MLLKSRSDIDPNRIGVIGFSEGGWVAPLAASKSSDIHFIVSISGGAFTKGHSFIHKYRQQFAEQNLSGEGLEKALAEKQAIVAESLEKVKSGRASTRKSLPNRPEYLLCQFPHYIFFFMTISFPS